MSVVTYTCFDGELVEENRDGTILDYVPDSLGSIIMWVDETGLPAGYTPYWPYGEPWQEPEVECPFQFVGSSGYFRDLSGTYVRAREYEPEEGRWMTVDPLWPDMPAFEYAHNNPIMITDRTGLRPSIPHECGRQFNDFVWNFCHRCSVAPTPGCRSLCSYYSHMYYSRCKNGPPVAEWEWDSWDIVPGVGVVPQPGMDFDPNLSPITFGYGNSCGLTRCGIGRDCIDIACAHHDACLATNAEFFNWYTQLHCNQALCISVLACLARGECRSRPECVAAGIMVAGLYCKLGFAGLP